MDAIIQIFRMEEVPKALRIRIIKKLGRAINDQYGSNITEPLVYELVLALNPDDPIRTDPHYVPYLTQD